MNEAVPSFFNAETLEHVFGPWLNARAIVLAVSGGPDSMALMLMAAAWRTASAGGRRVPEILAATVDHGLRQEARNEAELVAAAAGRLGIAHRTLVWQGEKPKTAIQEKAREARYALLFAHARKCGADVVMTAHHADDQAETILFRLLRGSGLSGLAGMRPETITDGIRIARPLLSLDKEQLIGICRDRGQDFAEDPSNLDPHYARTHLRQLLAHIEKLAGKPDWNRLAQRLARADDALAHIAEEVLKRAMLRSEGAASKLDFGLLAREPEEISLRILRAYLLQSGARAPLRLDRLETLNRRLREAASRGESAVSTLGGVKLSMKRDAHLHVIPEGQRRRGRAQIIVP